MTWVTMSIAIGAGESSALMAIVWCLSGRTGGTTARQVTRAGRAQIRNVRKP
jgi:hypothetical protein